MTTPGSGEQPPDTGPWDPSEQIGDTYEAEIADSGHVAHAERVHERPSIWVGSWLDYNNGILHGNWIPADRDDDKVWEDIQTMLANSPTAAETGEVAEDWGIFDYENFGPLRIGEQEALPWVTKVARGIANHGLAYAAYADVMEEYDTLDGFTDDYAGHYESAQAYVEHLNEEFGYDELLREALPERLHWYVRIDTEALARDLQIDGTFHAIPAAEGGVWVFRMNQ